MTVLTATAAEARTNFSRIASAVSETGERVTVFKNSKPWVVIAPASEVDADYVELVRSGILEGREQIASGLGIEGTDALRKTVAELRAQRD
ncbi:type II toxin-antitoxin system Phd/YefM family antitoxin [Adlercreutzia caecimuris]|uniref:type II toxin-antitoxin system Phd/YefM family antitoxin n=1 Tax=Adlercreutzia caecimuris TaxID=671266 RepID=UPI0024954629|nr:type II toxin-antitoxin system prevent-host-death family antitoxin [Adlercreutzia caecimuris]